MTPAQQTTLKTDIISAANAAALGAFIAASDWPSIQAYYNALASPQVLLWRPSIPIGELNRVIVWSAFAGLSALLQNTYLAMTQGGVIDATSASIRAGFGTIFGGASATAVAMTAVAQVGGTRFQVLFSSGNVSTMFGQQVSADDIQQAMLHG